MPSGLAETSFATGIKDNLAPVDVYKQTSAKAPIDSVTADVTLGAAAIPGLLGGNIPIASTTKAIQSNMMTSAALVKGLIATTPNALSALGNMSPSLAGIATAVKGVSNITATINGVATKIVGSTLADINSITTMLNAVCKQPYPITFVDNAAQLNLAVNLLKQAVTVGLPNAISHAFGCLQSNPLVLLNVTSELLPGIVSKGDVRALSEIAGALPKNVLKSISPNLAPKFVSNYTYPAGISSTSKLSTGLQISTTLSTIDPNWNKSVTSSGRVINNCAPLMKASPDMLDLLSISKASANVPISVIPKATTKYTATQAAASPYANWATSPPSGMTVATGSDSGGNPFKTYTSSSGKVTKVTDSPTGAKTVEEQYPAQQYNDNHSTYVGNAEVITNTDDTAYASPSEQRLIKQVVPSDPSLPPGTITTDDVMADGSTSIRNELPNGAVTESTLEIDGTMTDVDMEPDDSMACINTNPGIPTQPGDPLQGTSLAITSNPLVMPACVNDFSVSSIGASVYSGQPSLMSMDASQSVAASFPYSNW